MLQRRRRLDLHHEPLGAEYGRELGFEDFDRDVPVVLEILREVDRGHPAGAELALEAVSVGQRGCETVDHRPMRIIATIRLRERDP
jgi:hypothetical protein